MKKPVTQRDEDEYLNSVLPGANDFAEEGFGEAEPEMTEYEKRRILGTVAALSQPVKLVEE